MPDNYSITSLTEKEKEQILKLSKQNTLEEGIKYELRHMVNRCKEDGEEVTPLTVLEKIAIIFYNAYSTPASKSSSSNQDNSPPSTSRETSLLPHLSSSGSYNTNTDYSSDSSTNSGSSEVLPPKY